MRSGVITYQLESLRDAWGELDPLLYQHWQEISKFKDVPLEPNKAVYNQSEEMGLLKFYTVRCDGNLVGYEAVVVHQHMHYASIKCATVDVIYVLPEYRVGTVGIRLIKFADDALKSEGVSVVLHHVTDVRDFGRVLERLGYEEFETTYARRL